MLKPCSVCQTRSSGALWALAACVCMSNSNKRDPCNACNFCVLVQHLVDQSSMFVKQRGKDTVCSVVLWTHKHMLALADNFHQVGRQGQSVFHLWYCVVAGHWAPGCRIACLSPPEPPVWAVWSQFDSACGATAVPTTSHPDSTSTRVQHKRATGSVGLLSIVSIFINCPVHV